MTGRDMLDDGLLIRALQAGQRLEGNLDQSCGSRFAGQGSAIAEEVGGQARLAPLVPRPDAPPGHESGQSCEAALRLALIVSGREPDRCRRVAQTSSVSTISRGVSPKPGLLQHRYGSYRIRVNERLGPGAGRHGRKLA